MTEPESQDESTTRDVAKLADRFLQQRADERDIAIVERQLGRVGCPPREQVPHVQASRVQRSGIAQAPPNGLVIVDSGRGGGVQHGEVHRRTLTGKIARQVVAVVPVAREQCCGCAPVLAPHRADGAHADHPLRI